MIEKEQLTQHEMSADEVVSFYQELEKLGINIWLDGGWGTDALAGEQTRIHGDLDIIIQKKDADKVRSILESRGYKIIPRDDLSELNFHLQDQNGHEIDFTVIEFDEEGNGIYGPRENNEMNPADSFKGVGRINGQEIRCVSLEYAIKFKLDHEIGKHDAEDVRILCEKFGLEVPSRYLE